MSDEKLFGGACEKLQDLPFSCGLFVDIVRKMTFMVVSSSSSILYTTLKIRKRWVKRERELWSKLTGHRPRKYIEEMQPSFVSDQLRNHGRKIRHRRISRSNLHNVGKEDWQTEYLSSYALRRVYSSSERKFHQLIRMRSTSDYQCSTSLELWSLPSKLFCALSRVRVVAQKCGCSLRY